MQDMFRRLTAWGVILAPFLVAFYDIMIDLFIGRNATITAVVQGFADKWDEIPWIAASGFLWLWLHLFGRLVINKIFKGMNP